MGSENRCTISSYYEVKAHQKWSQSRCCFSQNALLWFEVLPDAPRFHAGGPRCADIQRDPSPGRQEAFNSLSEVQAEPSVPSWPHRSFRRKLGLLLIKGFISEHICHLKPTYNVCSVKDDWAWDLCYEIFFLVPVRTRHLSQFQLIWPHRRGRSSPLCEWHPAFRSYMGRMFLTTRDERNNWRWDNPRAVGIQVDHWNPVTTSLWEVKCTGERFSLHCSDDLRAKIEPPSCWQYMPGDISAVRMLNWDEIIDEDDGDQNWADSGGPSSWRGRPGDGNDNDDRNGEEDTQRGGKGSGKGKVTTDGKRNGKGRGKGNGEGKGIV